VQIKAVGEKAPCFKKFWTISFGCGSIMRNTKSYNFGWLPIYQGMGGLSFLGIIS
jgi:hypothetical protein